MQNVCVNICRVNLLNTWMTGGWSRITIWDSLGYNRIILNVPNGRNRQFCLPIFAGMVQSWSLTRKWLQDSCSLWETTSTLFCLLKNKFVFSSVTELLTTTLFALIKKKKIIITNCKEGVNGKGLNFHNKLTSKPKNKL